MKTKKSKFNADILRSQNEPIEILDKILKRDVSVDKPISRAEKQSRLVVLCMDGLCPQKIDSLIAQGKLKNFRKLRKKGASGVLKSTIPPSSLPAWPSFVTGKNPGKHGILDYFRYDTKRNEKIVINSSMFTDKRYWNIFNDHGYKTVVINMPVSFPPEQINGIMVSGHLSPRNRVFTHPEQLSEALKKTGYFTELATSKFFDYDLTKSEPYLYKIEKTLDAGLYIFKNYDWKVFTLGFMTPDKAHHMFGLNGESIDKIYEEMDRIIGVFLENLDQDTSIMVLSDHGFGFYEKEFSLYPWLYKKGLVGLAPFFHENKATQQQVDKTLKNKSNNVFRFIFLRVLYALYRLKCFLNLPSVPFFHFPQEVVEADTKTPCPLDWVKTKAFSTMPSTSGYLFININLKGREPFGIVNPGEEYSNLSKSIIQDLKSIVDPNTSLPVVESALSREDVYFGKNLESMPDIVVKLKKGYMGEASWADRRKMLKGQVFALYPKPVLNHHEDGIFFFCGPDVKEEVNLGDISILDICPTILHAMGLKVPEDIDGKAIQEAFRQDCINARPVEKISADVLKAKEWVKSHSKEDLEFINDELRRLGYLR